MKVALLAALLVVGQATPQKDSAPQPSKLATIRGRVVAASNGDPLPRVQVRLGSTPEALSTVTDARGEYELTDVPPGAYRVTAMRAGYLTIQHGQRQTGELGRILRVRAGDSAEGIDFVLPRWGVLAGVISDESGDPYANVTVEAVALRYLRGRRIPLAAAVTQTNDLGEFRLSGLDPGSYLLRAASTETWMDDDNTQRWTYGITYLPGVTDPAEAQSMSLALGQQLTGLAITMRPAPTARVTGVMRDAQGNPLAGQAISLERITRGVGGALVSAGAGGNARSDQSGAFDFAGLPPGEYNVVSGPASARVSETVVVTTGEHRHVDVSLAAAATLSGTVLSADGRALPFSPSSLRVIPILANPQILLTPWATARETSLTRDGTFRVQNISGAYLFRLDGLPDRWRLDRVLAQGRDHVDTPLSVPTGSDLAGVQLVVTDASVAVSGHVVTRSERPAPDCTVIVFADDRTRWGLASRFITAARPDAAGRYTVMGLPPGRYRVVARELVAEGQWEDAEFLGGLVSSARLVDLVAGETVTVDLTLEGRP